MPVFLDRDLRSVEIFANAKGFHGTSPIELQESTPGCLDIGLINNMPDGALEATERQFLNLLNSAAAGMVVRLSLYAMPDVPRGASGRSRVSGTYSSIEDIWDRHLDGIIVTGTEPRASNLSDEPYWGSLTRVMEWAEHNTHSNIWSCLAAHAAVFQMDGIGRRRLSDKRFGIFDCRRTAGHPLTTGARSTLRMPHSRWNDISEDDLMACGYHVLTRSNEAGADMFLKQRRSLSVFFQGHPEYEANTLLLEYRRDVGRYLRRERETYPTMPRAYFDADTAAVLEVVRQRALSDRHEELLADFPAAFAERTIANTWRPEATRIYRNWLMYVCRQKEKRLREKHSRKYIARETVPWFRPSVAAAEAK